MQPFNEYHEACKTLVETTLENALNTLDCPPHDHLLTQAMRYSVLGGGKRLRALLVYAGADALHAKPTPFTDACAAAVELIHAYSLVHDDLPAMDNDLLRRGKPTCHVAFGEAMAILAGDALQTLAFQVIANTQATHVGEALRLLALRSGAAGMVLGQADDLLAEGKAVSIDLLKRIHHHKTGALILGSLELGLLSGDCAPSQKAAFTKYGEKLGLLFQIQDDILDVESTPEMLGKATQKDDTLLKATYPGLLGLENAKKARDTLLQEVLHCLATIQADNSFLAEIARMAAGRVY